MNPPIILVPRDAAAKIRDGGVYGQVAVKVSDAENAASVRSISVKDGPRMATVLSPKTHFLNSGDDRSVGYWYRVAPLLHVHWVEMQRRSSTLTVDGFAGFVQSGFKRPGGEPYIALTFGPGADIAFAPLKIPEIAAWHVTKDGVEAMDIDVEPDVLGIRQLTGSWPVEHLASKTVMVVGAGSIGGAAVRALAGYGVGRLLLVDPDRLRWHNLVRHVCGPVHVGRMKVTALREDLRLLRPDTEVEAHSIDVVVDADRIRPMLERADLVVCAADGVAPRRVVSHLARRAGVDAVLGCVLEDGGIGEIIRLRPWADRGCLVCQRDTLTAGGGIDPEPFLDLGYGAGSRHRPMTAVGTDLHIVGEVLAKTAVATVLERAGHHDQRLAGEHLLLALRPRPGWARPFDFVRAGDTRWLDSSPPLPGCPTCEDPR